MTGCRGLGEEGTGSDYYNGDEVSLAGDENILDLNYVELVIARHRECTKCYQIVHFLP